MYRIVCSGHAIPKTLLTGHICSIHNLYRGHQKSHRPGLVNFVPAVAYHFCLILPATFSQPGNDSFGNPWTFKFQYPYNNTKSSLSLTTDLKCRLERAAFCLQSWEKRGGGMHSNEREWQGCAQARAAPGVGQHQQSGWKSGGGGGRKKKSLMDGMGPHGWNLWGALTRRRICYSLRVTVRQISEFCKYLVWSGYWFLGVAPSSVTPAPKPKNQSEGSPIFRKPWSSPNCYSNKMETIYWTCGGVVNMVNIKTCYWNCEDSAIWLLLSGTIISVPGDDDKRDPEREGWPCSLMLPILPIQSISGSRLLSSPGTFQSGHYQEIWRLLMMMMKMKSNL